MIRLFLSNFANDLRSGKWRITKFYPYTSVTQFRVAESRSSDEEQNAQLIEIFEVIKLIIDKSNVRMDNKVVFRLDYLPQSKDSYWTLGGTLYIGRYDGNIAMGFGVATEKYDTKYIKDVTYDLPI